MFYVIAKPLKKKRAKLHEEVKARLTQAGIPFEFWVTARRGEAREFAARVPADATVIVVGGDGTLNEVLRGLADPKTCTLGLIPAGTGNDFAAAAKIPEGIAALDLILNGQPQFTDYIAFGDGMRSFNIAGTGIDVDILLRCEAKKHFTRRCKYFFSLLASLCHFRGVKLKIRTDGASAEGTYLLAVVCNGSRFGGGIPICPHAQIADGKLEVVYVDCPKRRKIPFALIKLMRGKLFMLPFAHAVTCTEVEIVSGAHSMGEYDGELYEIGGDGESRLCARVVHGELKVYRGQDEPI